jgi:hypothetical protein
MKKKLSRLFVKIGLLAVLALSFPLTQAPASYCFASDDPPPIQDGSKERPKQGPDKKVETKPAETTSTVETVILLLTWLLG